MMDSDAQSVLTENSFEMVGPEDDVDKGSEMDLDPEEEVDMEQQIWKLIRAARLSQNSIQDQDLVDEWKKKMTMKSRGGDCWL